MSRPTFSEVFKIEGHADRGTNANRVVRLCNPTRARIGKQATRSGLVITAGGKPNAAKSRSSSPKVRVTLHVTKGFEGDVEVFIESSTLSTLLAEQEAKQAAKKKKFKYIEVISVTQI
jgi:hypothetical protein